MASNVQKPANMKLKNTLRIALIAIILSGTFLVLNSAPADKNQPCDESMEDCCKKDKAGDGKGGMIWENISQQFFSAF